MVVLGRAQAALFKDVLEVISDLFGDAKFSFSGRGFELHAMDTDGVAVVALLLPSEAFISYKCDSGLTLGLNLTCMTEFFRSANDSTFSIKTEDHIVRITLEPPEDGVIENDLVGVEAENYFVGDEAELFEIPEVPKTVYTARVRLPSEQFMLICERLNISPDSRDSETGVLITVCKDHVSFMTSEETLYSTTFTYTDANNPRKAVNIEMEENEVSQTFALRYMNSFSKASTLSDEVTICLSTELPALFECKIAGKGYIRYYIYPMV